MSAAEYLRKAVEYDVSGRKLEALKLYESGISALFDTYKCNNNLCTFLNQNHSYKLFKHFLISFFLINPFYTAETDATKKKYFQGKISEYMKRAEEIKVKIKERQSRGEMKEKIHILANGTGYSYEKIFGKYLDDGVREIALEEPYLREYYQVRAV